MAGSQSASSNVRNTPCPDRAVPPRRTSASRSATGTACVSAGESRSELARILIETGACLLASDALYVDDSFLPPQALPEDLFEGWREANQRHPMSGIRHALTELSRRGERPPADLPPVQPVCLHVSHGWGGGLWRWVEDAMEANAGDELAVRHLVLRPVGDWN